MTTSMAPATSSCQDNDLGLMAFLALLSSGVPFMAPGCQVSTHMAVAQSLPHLCLPTLHLTQAVLQGGCCGGAAARGCRQPRLAGN